MKKAVFCLMGAFLIAGCDKDIDGTLSVRHPLQLIGKKNSVTVLPVGSYKAEFELEDGGKELEMEVEDPRTGKEIKVEMKIPAGTVPERNGNFTIRGADVGQNFDLSGAINTQNQDSATHRDVVSCSYTETVRVCRDVPYTDPNTGRTRYRRECANEYITRYGSKEVEYYYRTTTVQVATHFTSPINGGSLGEFHGYRQDTRTINTYTGNCR